MSRRYPTAELYEERQSDLHRSAPRRTTRTLEDLEVEIARSQQDLAFLDEDYGRRSATAGALVVRERPAPPRSVVHEDDVVVELDERRRHGGRRRVERDEVVVDQRRREPRRREVERDEEIIVDHRVIRRDGRVADHTDDIIIRSDERPRHERRVDEREIILERPRHDRRIDERELILERPRHDRRIDERELILETPHDRRVDEREIVIERPRDRRTDEREIVLEHRAPPRPRARSREKEEIIVERRRRGSRGSSYSRSPPRRRRTGEEEIDISISRKREPSPIREPEPLAPIFKAPIHQAIHQEVITHHRHIDHGVERAYSPSPPPRARNAEETIEVDVRRRGRGGADNEEIVVEHNRRRVRDDEAVARRHRSYSPSRYRRGYDDDLQEEAAYYNRKAMQRAYVGEGYNGATRDWAIVDVPPGTERVRMDGAGGSAQEITWQRYNGVRRSKFLAGDREYDSGYGTGSAGEVEVPVANKMWTEITKDLVLRDAIDAFGYDYEETEFFFYVMEYLRYEEVLQLVELSEDMRQDRRRRIREIEWEREQLRLDREARRRDEGERYYEHEVIVEERRRR